MWIVKTDTIYHYIVDKSLECLLSETFRLYFSISISFTTSKSNSSLVKRSRSMLFLCPNLNASAVSPTRLKFFSRGSR